MRFPVWQFDEMRQIGVDFEDAEIKQYDSKHGSDRVADSRLVERLSIAPGNTVIDLGCGTGTFAREAAKAGARVRAIDVSSAMLSFVQSESAREGIGNLQVERAGFLSFDAPPDSVDVVVARSSLHHLPDFWKQVALLRVQRAIRPGGRLYLRDVVFSFEAASYEESIDNWIKRMPSQCGFSRAVFETHVREKFSTFAWVLEGLLEKAGFDILEKQYEATEYAEYICIPNEASRLPEAQ